MPKEKNKIIRYILLIVLVIVALELLLFFLNKTREGEKLIDEGENIGAGINNSVVHIKLPAIDAEGRGVSTLLTVEAEKGTGRTLADIENLLFWADTQQSIRMARLVADKFTNSSVKDYDLIYSVEANASVIGGPSAGAALTIATIFALEGKQPNPDVMITGTINHDGTIGPVSAILEKAKASKESGAKIFLVPLLQSRDVTYNTTQHCEKFGVAEICQTETIPTKVNVSEEAGISVIEVSNIDEALKYFS